MSDPHPDDPPAPAASPPSRSSEASRRLSQLLARPLGSAAATGEASEPRPAPSAPPSGSAPPPPDDTASAAAPPPAAHPQEPDLPWFDRPVAKPAVAPEPVSEPPEPVEAGLPSSPAPVADDEPSETAPASDDDLFERREPPPVHAPTPEDEVEWREPFAHRGEHEAPPRAADRVPAWAWPSALERAPEPAPPREDLREAPAPRGVPEPVRPASREGAPAAPAARPLDPDAARALGNIRRLMLISNLFMVVAIGAVLTVVGYRLYRSEPSAVPPAPPPVAAPAPAKIPVDMTLTLPRGARILQTAVAGERLVVTLEIDGTTEIRTFDIKTLQPAGRLSFATVP